MSSLNKVMLIGNLGEDPEVKHLEGGRALCNLRVATNEKFKGRDGALQERTEWHRVTVWGETAENCAKFLSKGRSVYVEGRLQTRSWEDKTDGKKHYATDIVADRVTFLGGPQGGHDRGGNAEVRGNAKPARTPWGAQGAAQSRDPGSDDIPY